MNNKFYKCACFLTNNYFLKKYKLHINYHGKEHFENEYAQILSNLGCNSTEDWEAVIKELEEEHERRRNLDISSASRKQEIAMKYKPIHPEIFNLQESFLTPEFLELTQLCKDNTAYDEVSKHLKDVSSGYRLYALPVFTKEFCHLLIEELVHFEKSPLPKGRPNTMNNYGILLNELGMNEDFLNPFREKYLFPISKLLFPEWTGPQLDSHKAFVVTYKMGEDLDLSGHYDNAEVTLNICLGEEFEGGELYFDGMQTDSNRNEDYFIQENKPTIGVLHRGQQFHGALPITEGERYNLIMWMRSSDVRNKLCPMCHCLPKLIDGQDAADGFTQTVVEMCSIE